MTLLLLVKGINDISAVSQEAIRISIVPHHLFSVPWTCRAGAVFNIDRIEALEVCVYQIAPDALVAVDTAEEQRGCFRLLQIQTKWRLSTPQARQSIFGNLAQIS